MHIDDILSRRHLATDEELAEIERLLEAEQKELAQQASKSPEAFRQLLPYRLNEWQDADFRALDPACLKLIGEQSGGEVRQRAWLERPRGHSKTTDIATLATWLLYASERRLTGIVGAGDRDQARLVRDAVDSLLRSPTMGWLSETLDVQAYRVVNRKTGSTLDILSSDAPTSFGQTPDFVIADELVHWRRQDLWDSLFSSAAKVDHCLLVVITNAGFSDSWQFNLREAVRGSEGWYVSVIEEPRASWITPERLREQRQLLPEIAYRRLWLNEWTQGAGDALSHDEILAAVRGDLKRQTKPEPGWTYLAGLDLGVSRDSSALCVLGVSTGYSERVIDRWVFDDWGIKRPKYKTVRHPGDDRVRLAYTRTWTPGKRRKLNLQTVEDTAYRVCSRLGVQTLRYDPWQAEHLAQRLKARGLRTEAVPFSGQNLQSMASEVLERFNGGTIELYEEPRLLEDLKKLRVVEKSYGFRLDSPRDATGHGDLATAFALALGGARDFRPRRDPMEWLHAGAF